MGKGKKITIMEARKLALDIGERIRTTKEYDAVELEIYTEEELQAALAQDREERRPITQDQVAEGLLEYEGVRYWKDRKEREKLPRWHCPSCGADTPMKDFDWTDSLSADLVRLAEEIGIPKEEQHWKWEPNEGSSFAKHGAFHVWGGFQVNIKAAVDAALKEISLTERGTQP